MIRIVLLLVLLPFAAAAQGFPGLYNVSGVAADDTLNVRTGPGTGYEVIGELAPDATGIEVVGSGEDGDWGMINLGEQAGWVSLAFMTRQPGDWSANPTSIARCFGTEPFWGLEVTPGSWTMTNMGSPVFSATPSELSTPSAATNYRAASAEVAGGGFATLAIRPELCSDGMSNMMYGLSALMVTRLPGEGTAAWAGCCSVQPR